MTDRKTKTLWALPPIDDKLRARLAQGAKLRAEMQQQILRGEEPLPTYRAQWLRESAAAIIRLLAERGESFNARHPDDAASMADHLDAVWFARTILLAQARASTDASKPKT